jgi:hypothetical protein
MTEKEIERIVDERIRAHVSEIAATLLSAGVAGVEWGIDDRPTSNPLEPSHRKGPYELLNDCCARLGVYLGELIYAARYDHTLTSFAPIDEALCQNQKELEARTRKEEEALQRKGKEVEGPELGRIFVVVARGHGPSGDVRANSGDAVQTAGYLNGLRVDRSEKGVEKFLAGAALGEWRFVITEVLGQVVVFAAAEEGLGYPE